MTYYGDDRSFTDYVHKHLAVPEIYTPLGWTEKEIDAAILEFRDMNEGVDYVFEDEVKYEISTQERFRDKFYKQYTDCTLRFRRDHNIDPTKHESEFFKIKADYLVYGITNGDKFLDKRKTLTGFLKYVVVDLKVLFEKIKGGKVVFKKGLRVSRVEDGKMIVPIIDNVDDSSSFVAFDVCQLNELFGKDGIIKAQKGFFN